jgi:hypothetical protein
MTGILCALPIIGAPTASPPANPLSVSRSPASVSGSASTSTVGTNSVTATASGGSGGYSYSWVRLSGDTNIAPTGSSSPTTAFQRTNCVAGTTYSATWRCTVTDSAGTQVTSGNVTVTITRTGATGGGGTFLGIANVTAAAASRVDQPIAVYTIKGDGSITYSTNNTDSWNGSTTVGSGYEVKATVTSGSVTGTTGSWLSLSSNRSWSITDTTQDGAARTATMTLSIRATGTTTNLDQATITLSADFQEPLVGDGFP